MKTRGELSVGGEVFNILCKRVAAEAYPTELSGVRFNAPCDGQGALVPTPPAGPADATPEAMQSRVRLEAMLARRQELVDAMDQVFGDKPVPGAGNYAPGELDDFLMRLVPFYDPPLELTPKNTRAIAKIMEKLLADPEGSTSRKVLETLARISPRLGYRSTERALGAVRPALSYPGLDELSRQFLPLFADADGMAPKGKAHDIFLNLLRAGSLEMAEPGEDVPLADRTLRVATDLLFQEDEAFATPGAEPLWVVKRDGKGDALLTGAGQALTGALPGPFKRAGDSWQFHDEFDRALDSAGGNLVYEYFDANKTVLAALMREQHPLLKRDDPATPSTVEKLARGLRPIMGPTAQRTETFNGNKASLQFNGPDIQQGPVFDLVHGLAALARYEETDRLLALLDELMKQYESEATATVYAGLEIDKLADQYPDAKLIGHDNTNKTAEFWDDLIAVGMQMLDRKSPEGERMIERVLRSFTSAEAVVNTRMIAKFMKHKDNVSYNGAGTISLNSEGKYSQTDADLFNTPVEHEFSEVIEDRAPGADLGMNRSLWQRLISTIHATNGAKNCNKQGGTLSVIDPVTADLTGGVPLVFPDPTHQPAATAPLEGVVRLVIDGACPYQGGKTPPATYDHCEFVQQENGAETHMRSMLLRSTIVLNDEQLMCLNDAGLAGDISHTQETEAQITGFTLTPTATAIARFIHVPRVKFMSDLFDPFPTIHGVELNAFEPNILFALEMKQSDVVLTEDDDGDEEDDTGPQSFLTASEGLGRAFDDTEYFEETDYGPVAKKGYTFADLLATFHMHWPSPRDTPCSADALSGNEGCSQRLDPNGPFYAKQSNVVSYEPLLIRAIEEQNLGEILQKASVKLASITIDGKDGVTILTDFIERVLTVDPELTYRDGRTYSKTNACVETTDAMTGNRACVDGRGRIIEGVTPIYLVLDALNRIDAAFEAENAERLTPWREARSKLVDQILTVDKSADGATYAMRNRRAKAMLHKIIPWARGIIAKHREADDLASWADRLDDRLANVLGHAATAAGLDLLDVVWGEQKAGAEFAKVSAYLMDEAGNPDAFKGLIVAASDSLNVIDRDDPGLEPIVQFASLALAPNALDIINSGGEPNVKESAAYNGLELARRVVALYTGAEPTPIAKILKNAVLPNAAGESPLESFIDGAAEVNRKNPKEPADKPLAYDDYKSVADQIRLFLTDGDRGMERLYKVIQGRDLDKAPPQPQAQAPAQGQGQGQQAAN